MKALLRKLWHATKRATPRRMRPFVYDAGLKFYRPSEAVSGKRLPKTTVVISADFELAWAWRYSDLGLKGALEMAREERERTPQIVSFLDEVRVPITWATVGHLALSSCERRADGRAHAELPELEPYVNPYWSLRGKDWFEFDPCSSLADAPEWYAPDLIEGILKARAGHEIGCHSFSHADSTPAHCPEAFFRGELELSEKAFARFGVKPTSFVFPGNMPGHHALLRERGYTSVRHYPWAEGVELAVPREHVPGLWGLHQSFLLEAFGWDPLYLSRKALRLLELSRGTGQVVSLWFHPSLNPIDFRSTFQPVIRRCAELRDRGEIEILTMAQLARRMETT
jgi:peptidoglycan/xylan/chitin deacetylase (PgdA/CDA1 family)